MEAMPRRVSGSKGRWEPLSAGSTATGEPIEIPRSLWGVEVPMPQG